MAGKKMRSRKNNAHNQGYARYHSENRRHINKEHKKRKHNALILKIADKVKERLELLQKCADKAKTQICIIKHIIGTPNISRLTSFLNETIFDKEWFLNKKPSKWLKQTTKNTNLAKYVERMGANLDTIR